MTDTKELRTDLAIATDTELAKFAEGIAEQNDATKRILDALPGLLDERDEKEDLADYWKNECDISTKLAEQAKADLAALRERVKQVEGLDVDGMVVVTLAPTFAGPGPTTQLTASGLLKWLVDRILSDDQPATEDTERCVCKSPQPIDHARLGRLCKRCGLPIQVQESDDE